MNDIANLPKSAEAGPFGGPYKYKPVEAAPRPAPKTAFGFVLGPKCRLWWARWFYEMAYPDKLATLTPEEADRVCHTVERTSRCMLPGLIYSEFPNLPRLRNRLLPVAGENVPQYYIFVLRDDATWQGMNAPLKPEDVEGVRQRLGVGDQEPQWYRIDGGAR